MKTNKQEEEEIKLIDLGYDGAWRKFWNDNKDMILKGLKAYIKIQINAKDIEEVIDVFRCYDMFNHWRNKLYKYKKYRPECESCPYSSSVSIEESCYKKSETLPCESWLFDKALFYLGILKHKVEGDAFWEDFNG